MSRAAMNPRRRFRSVCATEERDPAQAREVALDLYTLLPAASRRQLDTVQAMPAERRRMAISELYDALERGMAITNGWRPE